MPKRNARHERLEKLAEQAIEDLFSHTGVTQEETRESLAELKSNIQNKLRCIEADLRASEGKSN